MELNEIIQQRIEKRKAIEAIGESAHDRVLPGRVEISSILSNFQEGAKTVLAGRITAKRSHGKVSFLDLRDTSGRIQLYVKTTELPELKAKLFENVDIADILSVKGELFKTHTGEPTLRVDDLAILSKAIRPLPEKWHGLKDVEVRYRQRYLDLIANAEVKNIFVLRSKIIREIRNFLDLRAFCEVETPMMHDVPGGAAGRPFKTFHNEYKMDLYLRIAPELYLKRLLVGGMDKIYEINRSFRNEGVSSRHNPEFTMLEVYQAYADYEDMINLTQDLICHLAKELLGKDELIFQGKTIALKAPWKRQSFAGLVKEKFGIDPQDDPCLMLSKLQLKGFAKDKNRLSRSQINKVIEDTLEQDMQANPTFITDYFTTLCPLAKTKKDNPLISERFELYVSGMEIANAYSELNDPLEQRKRFEEEVKELNSDEQKSVDLDYVLALEHGMPPAGGLGIGIDRLVMLFADQPAIRDVILFPLLRSQEEVTE